MEGVVRKDRLGGGRLDYDPIRDLVRTGWVPGTQRTPGPVETYAG